MEGFVVVRRSSLFPEQDVMAIGRRLMESDVLVPGYAPSPRGLLDLVDLERDLLLGARFVLLTDRNLTSRMAWVAAHGLKSPLPPNDRTAIDLMAFCQAMDIAIEPSIAFHELAGPHGNAAAHAELAWFRSADHGNAQAWIDLAQGRSDQIAFSAPPSHGNEDLAFPLMRWRRNYVATLKIAELELTPMAPIDRILRLFDWMYDDFQWCGPAALFAVMYFGPRASRRGLLKDQRSHDRERAISGARNAAWDITHLSDFARRVNGGDPTDRYIFASTDRALVTLARLLPPAAVKADDFAHRVAQFSAWWPIADATRLAQRMLELIEQIDAGLQPRLAANPTDRFIAQGEVFLRQWSK